MSELDKERDKVKRFIEKKLSALVEEPEIVDADPHWGNIWKIIVIKLSSKPLIAPPPCWYVCTAGATSYYRSDSFVPHPWKTAQTEKSVVEMVKCFHLGLVARLQYAMRFKKKPKGKMN
jgi:hypothetical protein